MIPFSLALASLLSSPTLASDALEAPAAAEAAELPSFEAEPRHVIVSLLVATRLQHGHYSGRAIDDEVSRRWFDGYVDALDPNRMYFLESDLAPFRHYRTKLDDALREEMPPLDVAFDLFEVYRSRVIERTTMAESLLAMEHDLTNAETWTTDRSDAPFAESDEVLSDIWRKQIEDLLIRAELTEPVVEGDTTPTRAKVEERLQRRYSDLRTAVSQFDTTDVVEMFLGSLSRSFDPHSVYMAPVSHEDFAIRVSDTLQGIGAVLSREGDYTEIKELVAGGPASKSEALAPGDKIIAVAQGEASPVDIVGMRLDRVVRLIRGEKGTEVRLTVLAADAAPGAPAKIVPIIRDRVLLAEAAPKGTIETSDDGTKVGVIEIPSFIRGWDDRGRSVTRSTTSDVASILRDFRADDVETVIIDLRENGGGVLAEAIDLTGLFIDRGPVVQVKDTTGRIRVLSDTDRGTTWEGPLVVLTSARSASASEIFAGAIQDYDRGVVVGSETTHGKGSVQEINSLDPILEQILGERTPADLAGALKLTYAQFYRVSGGSTQNRGVPSDIVIPSPYDAVDYSESSLEHALPYDAIDSTRIRPLELASPHIEQLREQSAKRIADDEVLQQILQRTAEIRAQRARDVVSLVLEERRSGTDGSPDAEVTSSDPILDEAIRIALDYAEILKT